MRGWHLEGTYEAVASIGWSSLRYFAWREDGGGIRWCENAVGNWEHGEAEGIPSSKRKVVKGWHFSFFAEVSGCTCALAFGAVVSNRPSVGQIDWKI
jgi:hypothetical protein